MIHRQAKIKPLVTAILLTSITSPGLTLAEELVLEEVIVTAQLRAESLQDVPVSVSAVSGAKLMEAGIDKIEDLQAYVPNLTMSETGIGTNIYIRGIGSGINQGFEQSTGMYIDGVSHGRAQLSRAPFLDLERVEVLRGPQNILFGKNSISGALSMITAKPTDEFEGSVSVLYEPDHGEEVVDVVLSGPITDNFGARLAYRNRTMDGYMENVTTGDDEPNRDEETVRLTFDWEVSADLDLTLKVEHGEFDVTGRQIEIVNEEPGSAGLTYSQILVGAFGADVSVLDNTQNYQRTSNGDTSENETDNVTFTANYALGDNSLTFITGFVQYEYDEICDCDFTGANVFTLRSQEEYEQFSQEIRFASAVGQEWEFLGGVYFQTSELEFRDQIFIAANSILPAAVSAGNDTRAALDPTYPAAWAGTNPGAAIAQSTAARDFTTDTDLYSVFLQTTWNIQDNFRLTLGARYSSEEKDGSRVMNITDINNNVLPVDFSLPSPVDGSGTWGIDAVYGNVFKVERHDLKGSRDEDAFSPLVMLEYDVNADILLYGSATQGSKSGGFDARSNANPSGGLTGNIGAFEFEDEKATSLEFGAKTTLADGAAELNVALFYTEYEDLQVSIFDGTLGFNVGNAGEAETYGLELDGRWRLTESFTLIGALAFLDFEFTDYPNGQCNFGETPNSPDGTNCDYKGRTNQYVADWSGSITGDYFTPIGDSLQFRTTVDLVFTDDYNPTQTLDPGMDQDGYVKVNARIALADSNDTWEVAVVGKNLTDEDVMTYGNQTPLAGTSFSVASRYAFYERDRSVALQGTYRF